MTFIHDILARNSALLLFLVIGLGYLLGQIKVRGLGLGVAGVLFVGLAFGAWQPQGSPPLAISSEIREIGLILFVYAVGLSSGPGFFAALKQRGIHYSIVVVVSLVLGAAVALLMGHRAGLTPGLTAGVFCGSLTSTPAMAAVTQFLSADPIASTEPALGYSVTYPFAVLLFLLLFQAFAVFNRRGFKQEITAAGQRKRVDDALVTRDFEIRNPELFGKPVGELRVQDDYGVAVSRIKHGDDIFIPTQHTLLSEGDVVVAVGTHENLESAKSHFGADSTEHLELHRENVEMRRILVSRRELVGKSLRELNLDQRFNAQVTRLRRADLDMVPSPETGLELGDRLRVVMPRERVSEVTRFFGDSVRHIAELDYTAITLGICLGVLVGMIPISLPGGGRMTLGIAGGPLLVGLILGRIGRTGPIVWSIPLESNEALRHMGLLFFLAGVGVLSGSNFLGAVANNGVQLLTVAVTVTIVTTVTAMILLRSVARASLISTLGATSGVQTQPASLARAREMSGSDETFVAYAIAYPMSMVCKIILAQVIVMIGRMWE